MTGLRAEAIALDCRTESGETSAVPVAASGPLDEKEVIEASCSSCRTSKEKCNEN